MGIFDSFKRILNMDENLVKGTLTNQRVLDEMVELFIQQLRFRSVKKTMIFPMTFILYVHPSDYENLKESFPIFFPEIVEEFYAIIRKYSKRIPVIGAHATEWNVYIIPCLTEKVVLNEEEVSIAKGGLQVMCSLFDVIGSKSGGSGQVKQVSFCINGSVCMNDINLDRGYLEGVEIKGEGHFNMPWDDPYKTSSYRSAPIGESLASILTGKILAVLTCKMPDGKQMAYEMRDKTCKVSGENDSNSDRNVFRIPSSIMGTPHLEIRYSDKANRFEIAAYMPTKVDGELLPISKPEDMHWSPLSNGAQIGLTRKITITFLINN